MINSCKSIAIDIVIVFATSLLSLGWSLQLLFLHSQGKQVVLPYAFVLALAGVIGLIFSVLVPICIKVSDDGKIKIYSCLGFYSVNFDVHTQLASCDWDESEAYLKFVFIGSTIYRLSRHSFLNLKSVYKKINGVRRDKK
jgi:hypothetical protein